MIRLELTRAELEAVADLVAEEARQCRRSHNDGDVPGVLRDVARKIAEALDPPEPESSRRRYRCASPTCPGRLYPASEIPHPPNCGRDGT